jgi:REP element-mobilizing transposase RayT
LPRPKRYLPQEHSFHITLRCNSRQFLIAKRIRRDVLLVVLEKAKHKYPFRLYGVCLMANHIHLLLKPVTFRKDVTPGLPFRRPGLRVAPEAERALLLAC